ncbi:ThuA domain-containing protein [Sphingomonas colocasiae]|uniref:ThuA domain-containing protein n=1 Tax=Sphingomonas colocasiae TaxID=1848973 RepID=A0ABS7PY24_9SPHN|nr:ThuA domain-containing protein [Sphingomonas colocasiae]MBY8825242.1 ThuA domain-containing protein [Sphingomonas colocasiae]
MMRLSGPLKALLCAALAIGAQAAMAKAPPGKHIVLIGGRESHAPGEHAHPDGIRVLKALIETSPDLRGVSVDAYPEGWPDDPAALEHAATIIWYFDGLARHPLNDPARREQFGRLMKKGVGLVTLHQSSTLSPDDRAIPLPAWLGAARYGMLNRTDELAELTPARHPTMQGVRPFRYKDEFYPTLRFDTGHGRSVPVLSGPLGIQFQSGKTVAIAPETRTVAWAYERDGGGRAFLFTGAHYLNAFDEPDLRRMLLNAIVWTAGMPVPRNGVRSLAPVQAMGSAQPR